MSGSQISKLFRTAIGLDFSALVSFLTVRSSHCLIRKTLDAIVTNCKTPNIFRLITCSGMDLQVVRILMRKPSKHLKCDYDAFKPNKSVYAQTGQSNRRYYR